jgi:hypothetical protein
MVKVDLSEYMRKIGRKGGKKSGVARLTKLTPEQRSEVARKAAVARWGKKKPRAGTGAALPEHGAAPVAPDAQERHAAAAQRTARAKKAAAKSAKVRKAKAAKKRKGE